MKRRIALFLLIPILIMAVQLNEGRTIWTQDQGFFTKYRQIKVRALDVDGEAIIWGKENEFPTRELTFDPYNHYLVSCFEGFDATLMEHLFAEGPADLFIKDRLDTVWIDTTGVHTPDTDYYHNILSFESRGGEVNEFSVTLGVNSSFLLAATGKGLYESNDGGSRWGAVQPAIGTKYSSFTFDAVISPIIQTSPTPNMRRYFAAAKDGIYSRTGFFVDGWTLLPRIVEDQDFEGADPNNLDSLPEGWTQTGVEDDYKYVRLDTLISYSGDYSLLIHSSAIGGADVAARYGLPDLDRLVCGFQFMPMHHSGIIELKNKSGIKIAYRYGKMSYYTPSDGWVEIEESGVNEEVFNEIKLNLNFENEMLVLYTPNSIDTMGLYEVEDEVPEVVFSAESFGSGSQPYWIDDFYVQPEVLALAGHPDSIEYVYAGTPLGIYSYDGNEWISSLDITEKWFKLETDHMGKYMVASSDSLVYRSDNQGSSWDNITGDIPSINDIYVDANGVVYAATDSFPYKYDGMWSQMSDGFLDYGLMEMVKMCKAITMIEPDTIVVGNNNGIYVSVDGGNNWVESNEGIEPFPIDNTIVEEIDEFLEDAVPSDSTTGLIGLLSNEIGPIPDVDNDGLLHVVLLDIYEDGVDVSHAYFDVWNEYTEEEVPSGVETNYMEIVYVDLDDEVGWYDDPDDVKDEITRDITQMIEWNYDPEEFLPDPEEKEWIISGYEEYGVYLANIGVNDTIPEIKFSTKSLTTKTTPQVDLVHLFIQYLRSKFTDDILDDLNLAQVVKIDPQTGLSDTMKLQGIEAIDSVLSGRTPNNFVEAFKDWSISCYLDNLTYVQDVDFEVTGMDEIEECSQPFYSAKAWRIIDLQNPLVFSGNDDNDYNLHIVEYTDDSVSSYFEITNNDFDNPERNLHQMTSSADSFDLLVEVISLVPANAFYNLSVLVPDINPEDLIGVLQSPLADRFLRIYYYADHAYEIDTDTLPIPLTSVRLKDAGEEGGYVYFGADTSEMSLMAESSEEGYRIYSADIALPAGDGVETLLFHSEDLSGNIYESEYQISVKSIGVEGGFIASSDNIFRVDIPADALEKTYHITACNTGNSFYIGPSMVLNSNAILTIDVSNRESEDLSIYGKEGDNWIEIPCVRKGDMLEAEIGTLGEFKVMEGNLVTNIPKALALSTNTLNPFQIRYAVPERGKIRINIYNALGQRIRTLVDRVLNPGFYTIQWDGQAHNGVIVGNGIYFYRLSTPSESITKKIVLIR